MKRHGQPVRNLYLGPGLGQSLTGGRGLGRTIGPGQGLRLRLRDPRLCPYFPVRFRIPRQYWRFDPRRFPWGSMTWRREPGIGLPASPGVLDEEFVPREHTQGTGPGTSSHITDLEPYLGRGTTESKPSIAREEF